MAKTDQKSDSHGVLDLFFAECDRARAGVAPQPVKPEAIWITRKTEKGELLILVSDWPDAQILFGRVADIVMTFAELESLRRQHKGQRISDAVIVGISTVKKTIGGQIDEI